VTDRVRMLGVTVAAAVIAAAGAVLGTTSAAAGPHGRTIYVSVAGSPDGSGAAAHPYRSIEQALARAEPGDTIQLAAGNYGERFVTVHSGKPGAPITIAGQRGARITGDGSGRQVQIRNDWIVLRGLTIGNADKLVWVEHASHVLITNDMFENAGGECIRIKYLSTHVTVSHDLIDHCGLTGFDLSKNEHNGEGVYIGTDPGQIGRNPTRVPDATDHNAVIGNTIATYAAECVDIKEAADFNAVLGNNCSHSRDPKGSGFDARGNDNVFRDNVSADNAGAGIRFGGYGAHDGTHNTVIDNILVDNRGYGLLVLRQPQGEICGNVVRQNAQGVASVSGLHPTARCR
jgi:nitrous oxidase accessory protein NosD